MRLNLTTPPTAEVVTLADMKAHLRFGSDAEDALISSMVSAAVAQLEGRDGRLNRALLTQTWELYLPRFWRGRFGLPFAPLQSVDAITYKPALGGAAVTVDPAIYDVDVHSRPGAIQLKPGASWPTDLADDLAAVTVEFTCGYGGPDDIPPPIIAAIKLMAEDLFQNRSAQVQSGQPFQANATVDRLLTPFTVYNPDPLRLC